MENDSTPKNEYGDYGLVCGNCKKPIKPEKETPDAKIYGACKCMVDSTPSEGWVREIVKILVKHDIHGANYDTAVGEIQDLIAKARQEVYDEMECGWDICLTNAQYERCVEAQVKKAKQEARQECVEKIRHKKAEILAAKVDESGDLLGYRRGVNTLINGFAAEIDDLINLLEEEK